MSTNWRIVAVDAWCSTDLASLTSLVVDVLDVKGVDVAWEVTEDREEDVDDEIGTTAFDQEDSDRRDCASQLCVL